MNRPTANLEEQVAEPAQLEAEVRQNVKRPHDGV